MQNSQEQIVAALLVHQVVDREAEHGISRTMIPGRMPAI
jgi:hypothetical protein